ncbi:MAG: hypothetical protein ACRDC4_06510 [Plesiomonas sp.]
MAEEANFKATVWSVYKFLKAFHHRRVTQGPEEDGTQPARMARLARQLTSVSKPVFPKAKTEWLGFGNAKNWLYTGTIILQQHYEQVLREAGEDIKVMPRARWEEAWEVACKWARNNLKIVRPRTCQLAREEVRRLLSRQERGTAEAMEVQEAGLGPGQGPSGETGVEEDRDGGSSGGWFPF